MTTQHPLARELKELRRLMARARLLGSKIDAPKGRQGAIHHSRCNQIRDLIRSLLFGRLAPDTHLLNTPFGYRHPFPYLSGDDQKSRSDGYSLAWPPWTCRMRKAPRSRRSQTSIEGEYPRNWERRKWRRSTQFSSWILSRSCGPIPLIKHEGSLLATLQYRKTSIS